MRQEVREEYEWWQRVGTIMGATLHGWSGYARASFLDPHVELIGDVARLLLRQQETIEGPQAQLDK